LFQGTLAQGQGLQEPPTVEPGKPFVTEPVAGNLVTGPINPPDLFRVMIRTLARECRSPHYCEAGGNVELRVQVEQPIGVLELEMSSTGIH
jgi:hypothetical protein